VSKITEKHRQVLRDLARRVAEVAADPIQGRKVAEWKRHNALRPGKPLVLVYVEDVWEEFLPPGTIHCEDELCRGIEWTLRERLYRAEHLRDDWPLTAELTTPLTINDPGSGFRVEECRPDATGKRTTVAYEPVIGDDADPEDVFHKRTLAVDWDASRRRRDRVTDLVGDILTVDMVGWRNYGFTPIDAVVMMRGVERFFWDIVDRPQWVHAVIRQALEVEIDALRQCEALGALALNNGSDSVGSGGMAATDELPQADFDGRVRAKDLWGFATTQIFSEVSPAMHDDFAIQYESQFLSLFGLNCYGCCEPLHKKVHLVRKLPRVRRVSMSPFVDWVEGAEQIGGDFIYSCKPNPSYLAAETWDIEPCRREIETVLQAAKRNGCIVEFVLNGTLTSREEPHRYDAWTDMVQQLAEAYTP